VDPPLLANLDMHSKTGAPSVPELKVVVTDDQLLSTPQTLTLVVAPSSAASSAIANLQVAKTIIPRALQLDQAMLTLCSMPS